MLGIIFDESWEGLVGVNALFCYRLILPWTCRLPASAAAVACSFLTVLLLFYCFVSPYLSLFILYVWVCWIGPGWVTPSDK